jgi:hypothetical protein
MNTITSNTNMDMINTFKSFRNFVKNAAKIVSCIQFSK